MATIIGTFTKVENSYTGSIRTLTVNTKAKIVPVERDNDRAPDFRIYSGAIEFGGGWTKTAQGSGRDYISVKMDDPSFAKPIYASLVDADETGNVFHLIWSRPNGD